MRKVLLSMLTPDMKLAKPVYHYNKLYLNEGISQLTKYVKGLEQLGITSVYVDDGISDGIEVLDVISDKTRIKCKNTVYYTYESLKRAGVVEIDELSEVVNDIVEEVLEQPFMLMSLTDIGTTDDSTLTHSINVTIYALMLARLQGYSKTELKILAQGTLLHDIGKTVLNQTILFKPAALTEAEFEHVKQHTILGYNVLKKNPDISELARIISLTHHERLNGSGYPYGLKGDEIHEFSKIVAIADIYDALTANRCYRKGWSIPQAIQELTKESIDRLDPDLLGKFISQLAIYPNGSLVFLSNMKYAIVKEQNQYSPLRPIVRIIEEKGGKQETVEEIDLMTNLSITIIDEDM